MIRQLAFLFLTIYASLFLLFLMHIHHENEGVSARKIIAFLVATPLVVAGFTGIAWMGIQVAELQVPPETVGLKLYPLADVTITGTPDDPLVFADKQKPLRNFVFLKGAQTNPDLKDVITEAGAQAYEGSLDLKIIEADIDMARAEVQAGPQKGQQFWILLKQLPDPESFGAKKHEDL